MIAAALAAAVLAAPMPAEAGAKSGYWFADVQGALKLPQTPSDARYRRGLGAGLQIGYTGRIGLGLGVGVAYSPLPRTDIDSDARIDNHLLVATAMPRYTLGSSTIRLRVGAGGGVIGERTSLYFDGDQETLSRSRIEAAAVGEAALELHFFEGAGISFGAGYQRGMSKPSTRLLSVEGGLVLTF